MTSMNTHLLGLYGLYLRRGCLCLSESSVCDEAGLLAIPIFELLGRSRCRQYRDGRLRVAASFLGLARRSLPVGRWTQRGKAGLKCRGTGFTGFLKPTASLLSSPQSAQHWPGVEGRDRKKVVFCTPASQYEAVAEISAVSSLDGSGDGDSVRVQFFARAATKTRRPSGRDVAWQWRRSRRSGQWRERCPRVRGAHRQDDAAGANSANIGGS